mgnify:CR=1 FL=1
MIVQKLLLLANNMEILNKKLQITYKVKVVINVLMPLEFQKKLNQLMNLLKMQKIFMAINMNTVMLFIKILQLTF